MAYLTRRLNFLLTIAVVLFLVVSFNLTYFSGSFLRSEALREPTTTARHVWTHIAVASYVGWHFEIYMGMVATLEQTVLKSENHTVQVYIPDRFGYGFDELADELELYHGQMSDKESFFRDIDSTNLYPEDQGTSMIDLVILPSCDWDLREWHSRLLDSWNARPVDKKFQLVCMFHHGDEIRFDDNLVEWVRRDSLRLLSISEHVTRRLRRNFRELAESRNETLNSAGYEYVKIDTYVPILDLPQKQQKPHLKALTDVAIEGSFRFERRDYLGIYADLLASFEEDPRAWGYLPLATPESIYEPDEAALTPPLHLHLIGNAGDPQVPPLLANVIRVHNDLQYKDFFDVIQTMDLVIPGWSTLEYYEAKASFTMAISIQCNVPVLVNSWSRESYSFLDDCVTVTRPQAVREIFAVKALRTGYWSPRPGPATEYQLPRVKSDMDKMIAKGWRCSDERYAEYKRGIWADNTEVMKRILREMPVQDSRMTGP